MQTRYTAQHGEDIELERRFHGRTGVFVDIGAADGVLFSNTHRLEELGWTGLLVEANPEEAERCRDSRSATVVNAAAVAPGQPATVTFEVAVDNPGLSALKITDMGRDRLQNWTGQVKIREVTVTARTADELIETAGIHRVDVLSIDVEGHERAVLAGFDLTRWKPQVVILERNMLLPDRAVMRTMHRAGYIYQQTTGVNDWFVPGRVSLGYRLRRVGFYLPKIARGVVNHVRRVARG